jgi:hypothetical protein
VELNRVVVGRNTVNTTHPQTGHEQHDVVGTVRQSELIVRQPSCLRSVVDVVDVVGQRILVGSDVYLR